MGDVTAPEIRPRPYEHVDMTRLLPTFASWIAETGPCGYDHVGELPVRIYDGLRGRRPVGDLVHVWEREADAGIVGLTICLRFGQAFDVFAAPSLRGTAAEREMITFAAAVTAATATATALATASPAPPAVFTDVFSGDKERIRLLTELGFEHFRTWDHVRERVLDRPFGEPTVPPGFLLRSVVAEDAEHLAAARNSAFDDDWTGEQYRAEVMEKPGYDPSREIVAVAPDGRIAAFTIYWTDELNKTGHYEPVGTHRDFQRLGLARAVMLHAMRQMRDAGLATATVNHDAENIAAARLYESLGFQVKETTLGFRRMLDRPEGGVAE